jgi:hypothetical protein
MMKDLRIFNGDTFYFADGSPAEVEGIDLLAQQAALAAKIPKGSFVYDRSMGAFSYTPDTERPNFKETAEARLRESLVGTGGSFSVLSYSESEGEISLNVQISDGYSITEREVRING